MPHGVDCDHYAPSHDAVDEQRICFWGGLDFGPNVSAVRFFAQKVWPDVRRRFPDLRWTLLGRGDGEQLEAVRRLEGVDWLGYVDDIRPHVHRAAITIVPPSFTMGSTPVRPLTHW